MTFAVWLLIIIMLFLVKESLKIFNSPTGGEKPSRRIYVAAATLWVLFFVLRVLLVYEKQIKSTFMLTFLLLFEYIILLIILLLVMWQLKQEISKFSKTLRELLSEGIEDIDRQKWVIGTCIVIKICCAAAILTTIALKEDTDDPQADLETSYKLEMWVRPFRFAAIVTPLIYITVNHIRVFREVPLEERIQSLISTDD